MCACNVSPRAIGLWTGRDLVTNDAQVFDKVHLRTEKFVPLERGAKTERKQKTKTNDKSQ